MCIKEGVNGFTKIRTMFSCLSSVTLLTRLFIDDRLIPNLVSSESDVRKDELEDSLRSGLSVSNDRS